MKESCQRSSSSLVNSQSNLVTIHFPNDGFLLTQIVVGALCSVYAFKEYVSDDIGGVIASIVIAILIMFTRAKFKTRPPEWALVDPVKKVLRLKHRWPNLSEIEIDISKLKSAEAHVPRFRRFAVTLLNLHFEKMDKVTIIFGAESSETRFFATPNEVVPPTVEELVEVLRKVSIENESSQ